MKEGWPGQAGVSTRKPEQVLLRESEAKFSIEAATKESCSGQAMGGPTVFISLILQPPMVQARPG